MGPPQQAHPIVVQPFADIGNLGNQITKMGEMVAKGGGGGKSSSVPRFLFPGLDVGTASEVWGMRTGLEYKKACSSSIPCIPLRTK